MAGWLSSKLKEAEQFLQQIDQQAAESLGKPEQHTPGAIAKDRHGAFGEQEPNHLLATQKGFSRETLPRGKLELGKEAAPSALNKSSRLSTNNYEAKGNLYNKQQGRLHAVQIVKDAGDNVAKEDWTELLTSPNIDAVASPALASSVGSSDSGHADHFKGSSSRFKSDTSKNGIRRGRNIAHGNSERKVQPPSTSSSASFSNAGRGDSIGEASPRKLFDDTLPRHLDIQLVGKEAGVKDLAPNIVKGETNGSEIDDGAGGANTLVSERLAKLEGKIKDVRDDCAVKTVLTHKWMEGGLESLEQVHESSCLTSQDVDHLAARSHGSKVVTRPLDPSMHRTDLGETYHELQEETGAGQDVSPDVTGNSRASLVSEAEDGHLNVEGRGLPVSQMTPDIILSLESDIDSYESSSMSDTESEVESDSEADKEIERRKSAHKQRISRRRELAAARVAAAQAAVRECQLFVEKLEKEEAALRRVLAEREEQQGREAAELRLTIAELMQALEAEKKLHNSTRMQALTKESGLENQNADLAKSLGALQWELEEQMSQVLKARGMVEAKEVVKAELEREIAKIQGDMCCAKRGEEVDGAKDGDFSFEKEHSELWKKIQHCQIQVRDLEVKISGLKNTHNVPTEIEKELENHLAKLTDQLIQKQAQVEALAAEKATLSIRLEGLYKVMEEEKRVFSSQASRNKLASQRSLEWDANFYDMEYGLRRSYDSKLKASSVELGESMATASSGLPLAPVLCQLNGFFSTGMFYLRKHRWAQACAVVYIIVLHLWFWFVVLNSRPTQTLTSQEFGITSNVSEFKYTSNVTNLL